MTEVYDVIIVGGGPTGVALGIELGLNNLKTLILEKHGQPLLSPRAQSLNERSMEFFIRWGLLDKITEQVLFPKGYPIRGVWCSKLNGKTYATAGSREQFEKPLTAAPAIRLPLYITENILRARLSELSTVKMLLNEPVTNISFENELVCVSTLAKKNNAQHRYQAKFVIGCDGANSITRQLMHIPFSELAPKRRVINILFKAPALENKITVEKGFLYYLLENKSIAALGSVDITKHIWYAQIVYHGETTNIDEIDVEGLLDEISGIQFQKKILNKHFWDMQIKLASHYSKDNRLFLVGDSAHAFAPTGGFGLNTGLGDVTNLAWKLAAIINDGASTDILHSYESERRPIAIRNLNAAEKNAADAVATRTKFPPNKDPEGFAKENARIAKQHAHAGGITLGYTYDKNEPAPPQSEYQPTYKTGYFLPHTIIGTQSIYELLSATQWTLITAESDKKLTQLNQLSIVKVPTNTYPYKYILIRPDWHIALISDTLSEEQIKNYIKKTYATGKFATHRNRE